MQPLNRKYSPIGPISILESLQRNEVLGDYLLLLAHDVVANPKRYFDLIQRQRQQYPDLFIIMDNSVIELGQPMNSDDVRTAVDLIGADVMMLPDVLGDSNATKEQAKKAINDHADGDFQFMFVPQGKTLTELKKSVQWYFDYGVEGPLYFGVPRWITNQPEIGTRLTITDYINETVEQLEDPDLKIYIHMLGMSKSFKDDMCCTKLANVMGIDSANPLVIGQKNINLQTVIMHKGLDDIHIPRGDYFDNTNKVGSEGHASVCSIDNINFIREQINIPHVWN